MRYVNLALIKRSLVIEIIARYPYFNHPLLHLKNRTFWTILLIPIRHHITAAKDKTSVKLKLAKKSEFECRISAAGALFQHWARGKDIGERRHSLRVAIPRESPAQHRTLIRILRPQVRRCRSEIVVDLVAPFTLARNTPARRPWFA